MKSLNSFVELYKPKSPDEQKFVDKHVVKTRGDANGNGDDVFKGSKVKKVERTKERKGYEPGDDEKVYEEAEQIDEISAKLARKAAAASAAKSFEYGSSAYDDESQKNADRLDKKSDKAYAHVMKRQGQKGVDKTNRLAGKLIYGKSRAFEETEQVDEKMHMKTADMGDVITDFQKSDAPQFKGKTKAQRRVMAIAAKLSAERGGKPMKEEVSVEETLENLIADLSESNQRVMFSVFAKLTEENQEKFLAACQAEGGVDAMLDFSIKHRNVE